MPPRGILGLFHNLPVGAEEDDKIQGDQGKRDDRPATALHLFVFERDEHGKDLSVAEETREAGLERVWKRGELRV